MNFKAFALTGRKADCWFTQGDCPGLGASAPSGRVGHWLYYLLNYHFPKKHGNFPNNAPVFPKKPPIFPKSSRFSGRVWGKACRKMRVFSCLFVNNMRFFLVFPCLACRLFIFPKKCPIFPKIVGFSGELWERDCFALVFAVLLQRRRNKTTLKWFGALENLFVHYILCILRL